MKKTKWLMYSDFAWTEHIIAPPEDYVEETNLFSKVIKEHSKIEARTLLHLGCGAGGNDYTFKRHFKVTGVDISDDMLEIARKLNPEVIYLNGDMRTIRLKECFDAVAIPDSIGHMTTLEDLRKAILTAYKHLKPGGVLLIVTLISEEFRENNFVYTGSKGDVEITIFENNHVPDPAGTTYEATGVYNTPRNSLKWDPSSRRLSHELSAKQNRLSSSHLYLTLIYLIRRKGKLEIHSETGIIGLFKLSTWLGLLKEIGLEVKQMKLEHSYDRFLVGEGKYTLDMFVCSKPL